MPRHNFLHCRRSCGAYSAGMESDRRDILKGAGFGLIAVQLGGVASFVSAAEARRRALPFKVLDTAQARTLAMLGEVLLPGAKAAGVAHFVDDQLAKDPAECLLMLRYFDWPPPYAPFYLGGLAALDSAARAAHQVAFASLDAGQATALVGQLLGGKVAGWQGPPSPLFYLATRADAVDVVYGTMAGTAKLGLPYMAHIEPEAHW